MSYNQRANSVDLDEAFHYELPYLDQGPVVQSIVSIMSSLRDQLIKCFTIL